MNNEKEMTVSEQETERLNSWYDLRSNKKWIGIALDSYRGPGIYEGSGTIRKPGEYGKDIGFEITSLGYSFKEFRKLIQGITAEDGTNLISSENFRGYDIAFREPVESAENIDLTGLDQHMEDLHWYLGIYDTEDRSDEFTVVNIENRKVTGVIMDDVDITTQSRTEELQKLYDFLSEKYESLVKKSGYDSLEGLVITTCGNPEDSDQDDYIDAKGANSRAVYDDEHNTVVVMTGTFVFDEEENQRIREEAYA